VKLSDKIELTEKFLKLVKPKMKPCNPMHAACPHCTQHIMYAYCEDYYDLLLWERDELKKPKEK